MTRTKNLTKALSRHISTKLLLFLLLATGTGLLIGAIHFLKQSGLFHAAEQFTFWLNETYERWFSQQTTSNPIVLLSLSFAGGLIASISPCILSMLPVNLSYIGTREITSCRDAIVKAGSFVLGVVTILSLLGLFSAFAGIVLVQFRGYFQVAIGSVILLMGLSLLGIVRLPLPQLIRSRVTPSATQPERSLLDTVRSILIGPYGVGVTFALVSSPCTSPIMFGVLAAAAATGSQVQGMLAMVCYALGYSAIIFFASVFAGFAKQARGLLRHSELIIRVASGMLILVGGFYLVNGIHWLLAMWS
jgi:cytochrome c-type biogenesis protein